MDQLVLEPDEGGGGGLKNPLTYVSIEKKQGMKRSLSTSSLPPPRRRSSSRGSSENLLGLHDSPRRAFSRAMKTVLFETISSKRVRDRKALHQDSRHGSSTSDQKSRNASEHNYSGNKLFFLEQSNPMLSCSSSSPEDLSKALSKVDRKLRNLNPELKGIIEPKKTDNSGMYLLLISLILTVICGKLRAILFTSIWLYFLTLLANGRKDKK